MWTLKSFFKLDFLEPTRHRFHVWVPRLTFFSAVTAWSFFCTVTQSTKKDTRDKVEDVRIERSYAIDGGEPTHGVEVETDRGRGRSAMETCDCGSRWRTL